MSEREIVFRIKLPARPRTRWLLGIGGAVLIGGAVAYAAVPNIFSAGDSLSASKLNADLSNLDSRLAALETRSVSAHYHSATHTFPAGATGSEGDTVFTTRDWDTANSYSIGTGKFTAPISGTYQLCASVSASRVAGQVGDYYFLYSDKNGAGYDTVNVLALFAWQNTSSLTVAATTGCDTVRLAAGDSLALGFSNRTAGTSLTPDGWISIDWLGN